MCAPVEHWACFKLALRRYHIANAILELHYCLIELERTQEDEKDYAKEHNNKEFEKRQIAARRATGSIRSA